MDDDFGTDWILISFEPKATAAPKPAAVSTCPKCGKALGKKHKCKAAK